MQKLCSSYNSEQWKRTVAKNFYPQGTLQQSNSSHVVITNEETYNAYKQPTTIPCRTRPAFITCSNSSSVSRLSDAAPHITWRTLERSNSEMMGLLTKLTITGGTNATMVTWKQSKPQQKSLRANDENMSRLSASASPEFCGDSCTSGVCHSGRNIMGHLLVKFIKPQNYYLK